LIYLSCSPPGPVQGAVADAFAEVVDGDGAGQLEYPGVGPGGQAQALHGRFQELSAVFFQGAEPAEVLVLHLGVVTAGSQAPAWEPFLGSSGFQCLDDLQDEAGASKTGCPNRSLGTSLKVH